MLLIDDFLEFLYLIPFFLYFLLNLRINLILRINHLPQIFILLNMLHLFRYSFISLLQDLPLRQNFELILFQPKVITIQLISSLLNLLPFTLQLQALLLNFHFLLYNPLLPLSQITFLLLKLSLISFQSFTFQLEFLK